MGERTLHPPLAPWLGAIAQRRAWRRRGVRQLLVAAVAALSLLTAAHHLLPMHDAMPAGAPPHDHAMPIASACLGVIDSAFVLAYVGAIVAVRRPRRLRRARQVAQPRSRVQAAGRQPCRDGPPPYLRFQVLRT